MQLSARLRHADIGTAGFDGFLPGDAGQEVYWYKGGHGAALGNDDNLSQLIHYTLTGDPSVRYSTNPKITPGWRSLVSRAIFYLPYPLTFALLFFHYRYLQHNR